MCFALKANSNITLLRELKKMGSGADVVSIGELLKATKAGINVKKIVFSGIGKTEEEIRIEQGRIQEIRFLLELEHTARAVHKAAQNPN